MSPGAAQDSAAAAAAMESRFADLCKIGLGLDESTARQAMALFCETKPILTLSMSGIGGGSPEEMERLWSALVLYCVMRLSRGKAEEGGMKLGQILKAARLKVVDFFKEMPQFSIKVGHILKGRYGSDWESRLELKELQANVVHLSCLSRYYKKAYQDFFLSNGAVGGQDSAVTSSMGYASDYHRFGWLLFLALRVHAVSRFKDMVTCTYGLVSILAILILHVPTHFRKFKIQDSNLFVAKSDKGVDLLASLCVIYHTSEDELKRTMEKVNNLIGDILKKKPCRASECRNGNFGYINTDGLTYFENLLEEKSLQTSLLVLEKDYDDAINFKCELDERMFANDEDSLLGTGSLSGGAVNISGTKRKFDAVSSPAKTMASPLCPLSPASPRSSFANNSKMAPITPVSTAMTTAKWLRDVISPLPSNPSQELERFLSLCGCNTTSDVIRRANIILEAIFPSSSLFCGRSSGSLKSANLMDSIWAEQRKSEALKLYYRVLEAICKAESHILNGNSLTSLLSNERFHRCMLACSAELVLATHKTVTMMFPAVLERTGITAFDLSRVIECFVRHEETLPRELKRHLNSLEERLLESLAWENGSSMYNSLIVARPSLSAEINRLGLLAEPMQSLDAIAMHHKLAIGGLPTLPSETSECLRDQNGNESPKRKCGELKNVLAERNSFTSPVKDRMSTLNSFKSKLLPLQSAFASPTRRNPVGGETCAEAGISVFFNKIEKLAATRIKSLCERLQLSSQILEHVYCLVQKVLTQQTSLFFNRHVDQLILCSFYGVAKISQLTLTFKEIIYNYRKQPQCKPQVFRSVFVNRPSTSRNGDHVDIITFYNEIFIPTVKPILSELGPVKVGAVQESNKYIKETSAGQIPGSPQRSRFPSLPDMSPKKVSPSHNIYVSPLRQSKMLSPSSKSYYACVGESTRAYQSPSKDLTAINTRLNCGSARKVNGKLNFDLVSDSVVVGSLGPQNVSPASSAITRSLDLNVKSEESDT